METYIENLDKLDKLLSFMNQLMNNGYPQTNTVEWIPVSTVAKLRGLTSDAVRKKLKNGDFVEGCDFKYIGSRILINQGAIELIKRQRRSSNG